MKMRNYILPLLVLVALVTVSTAAAQNAGITRLGRYREGGVKCLGIATTTLAVDVTIRTERIVSGPYARYAQKFLGLRVPLSDKTQCSVVGGAIALFEEYPTAGPLPAETTVVESYEAQDELFAMLSIDRMGAVEADPESAAGQAAAMIFSLRRHRLELITGEAGEHVFGEGLAAALERIDRMEQELLELFLGRRVVTERTDRFYITPEEGQFQQIVCRFSADRGIVPAGDLSGDIVLLQFQPGNLVATLENDPKGAGLPYRVAAVTLCTLVAEGHDVISQQLPIYQFGQTVSVAAAKK